MVADLSPRGPPLSRVTMAFLCRSATNSITLHVVLVISSTFIIRVKFLYLILWKVGNVLPQHKFWLSYLKTKEVSRDVERKLEKIFDLFINDIRVQLLWLKQRVQMQQVFQPEIGWKKTNKYFSHCELEFMKIYIFAKS